MTDVVDDDARELSGKGPDAFRTISEVAEELDLPQHVLRFWETRFPQIKPVKRGGGRRYYRPGDVDLLRGVKQLLYGQGYTIRGVQRILREQGGRRLAQAAGTAPSERRDPDFSPGDQLSSEIQDGSAASPDDLGPELWAPGRRPVAQNVARGGDPEEADDAYDHASGHHQTERDTMAPMTGVERMSAARPAGLTDEQVGRLSSALDELSAVKKLLDGRF